MCVFKYNRLASSIIAKVTKPLTTIASIALLIGGCGSGSGADDPDPLAVDTAIAYIERPVPTDDDGNIVSDNILDPDAFNPGASLFIRSRSNQSAEEINLTDTIFGAGALYDVKDVAVSYDGRRLLFSIRAPEPENNGDPEPTWNIWEYDLDTNALTRIINDGVRAEEGHDISPAYLPDGRIVFSSNRQVRSRTVLLDESLLTETKAVFNATIDDEDIFNLHVIDLANDPNGANIQQITFNQSHDLQPTVLSDGRLAYLRNDTADGRDNISIYTINADGSNARIFYGYHSQTTGNSSNNETTFIDFRELSNGSLMAILQERESNQLGGDIIQINTDGFTDISQPTYDNSGDNEPGQNTITVGDVNLDSGISNHGYFNSAYPLGDGSLRFLVSWNPCRLQDPETEEILACTTENLANDTLEFAPPFYGLWTYDASGGTQTPVATAEEGRMFTDVVVLESRTLPPVSAAEPALDSEMVEDNVASLHIRSVYDTDGTDTVSADTNDAFSTISTLANPFLSTANDRPARFLRLIKAVSIPSDDVLDFDNTVVGINQGRSMREILGYVPIEPDGSVKVQVPADVAFYFDIVDANGERTSPIHRNWLHLTSGETYECTGCHLANSTLPHGRLDAEPPSANPGGTLIGLPFPNTEPDLAISNIGDTMAEVYAQQNGTRRLNTGMTYTDDWTDPSIRGKDADYNLLYVGDANLAGLTTPPPVASSCQTEWSVTCRTIINYVSHIQPLWEASRPDGLGGDNQCIACHSRTDAMSNLQEPDAQLELTSQASTVEPAHLISYRELFETDFPFLIDPNGNQLTLYTYSFINGEQQFYRDSDGNLIEDEFMQPIPEIRIAVPGDTNLRVQSFTGNDGDTYQINNVDILDANNNPIIFTAEVPEDDQPGPPVMTTSSSANSRFFDEMNDSSHLIDHTDFMSPNELRLLREWLDIGGQYYNNPFDAPN